MTLLCLMKRNSQIQKWPWNPWAPSWKLQIYAPDDTLNMQNLVGGKREVKFSTMVVLSAMHLPFCAHTFVFTLIPNSCVLYIIISHTSHVETDPSSVTSYILYPWFKTQKRYCCDSDQVKRASLFHFMGYTIKKYSGAENTMC